MHVIAGKAVSFELAMTQEFKQYQVRVVANARAMADELHSLGYRIVSGGTDTHLLLVDLSSRSTAGAQAQVWLGEAGIIANKNAIPFDLRPPIDPSGIRLGTPSITTRGAGEDEARLVVRWIHRILSADNPLKTAKALRPEVLEFCRTHPIPD
jgi:glycine hydroxymethyltransferase